MYSQRAKREGRPYWEEARKRYINETSELKKWTVTSVARVYGSCGCIGISVDTPASVP